MKLKTRFKIAIIIMILSVAIMNMAIVSFYISNSLKKNSEQAMHSINKQKMITIENLLDSFVTMTQKPLIDESMMDILVKEYEEKPNTSVRYQMYEDIDLMGERLYSEMYYRNEYIYGVTIFVANDGRTYYKQRSGKRYLEKDPESLEWYQELLKTDGKEAVLFPYMKEDLYLGEEPIIAIGRLLKNPMTNQIAGVIRIDIAVKDLGKIWEDDEMGGTTKVVFFDKNKELLYTSFPAENWKKEYEKQRKKHLEVMTASERYGVFIATLLTRNQMYEEAYKVIFTIVVITLGGILFSLFWVEFILNKSMQPIGELNRLMKEVREGDLSVRAKVGTDGEFEEVCESFNLMVENTEHLIERVRLEESEKMEAEYRALQAQISPHFILNTLNTIRWMAVIQGNKAIDKALDSFSRLLAFVVRRREDTIPIREELEQMNYYIDILSLRYYNKFQIEMDVEEEVKSCLTVKFLLQTLVENSVFHGFDEMSGKGEIKVKVCRRSDSIVYEVQDNGKGICEERIEEILKKERKEQKGMVKIGLYNINRRIKLVFGEEYGISIRSVPGEYTVVSVVIPAQEEKMLKIVIVDDEYFVRMGIKSIIQQNECGYIVSAEADNGITAVDVIQKEDPDIIFLDITMPGMNGIEVLEKVRKAEIGGFIAMLTCHEDFRLVQQAMRLGADDYVLKNELAGDVLIDYLEKVSEKIEKNSASHKKETISELEKQREEHFYKENFLKNILQIGGINKDEFIRGASRYHVKIHNNGIYIISIYMKMWEKIVERYKDSDLQLLYRTIDNMLAESIKNHEEWEGFYSEPYCYQILFTCSKEKSQLAVEEKIRSIVNSLTYHFKYILDIDIVISVYRNEYLLEELPKGYQEARKLLEQRFFRKDKKIFWSGIQNAYQAADMDMLKESFESKQTESFREEIEKFLLQQRDRLIDKSEFFEILRRQFLPYVEQNNLGVSFDVGDYDTVEEILDAVAQIDMSVCEDEKGEGYSFLVRQAVQIIQKEFTTKITLEKVADQLGISAGYFSRIFSAETQETFSNYVIRKRIEYAKELIATTNYKFYEIAELCGFNSSVHFNNTFKKICGVTPNQYRNEN